MNTYLFLKENNYIDYYSYDLEPKHIKWFIEVPERYVAYKNYII